MKPALFLALCCAYLVAEGRKAEGRNKRPQETVHVEPISRPPRTQLDKPDSSQSQSCSDRKDCAGCGDECSWEVSDGSSGLYYYSLSELCGLAFESTLHNPRGATLEIGICGTIKCGASLQAKGCITVPGVPPTVSGKTSMFKLLVGESPSYGFQLIFDGGDVCEVNGKPRQTIITFPCDPTKTVPSVGDLKPDKAYEGEKKDICHYYIIFPSTELGCPLRHAGSTHSVIIDGVSGCIDTDPIKTTSNCLPSGGQTLTIRATGTSSLCPEEHPSAMGSSATLRHEQLHVDPDRCTSSLRNKHCILVGTTECADITVENAFTISCTLGAGSGIGLSVKIKRMGVGSDGCGSGEVVAEMPNAVSYKAIVNFREKFNQFVEYGVGGLKKEIDELYRRAFASRGVSTELLSQLGVTHVKGILLHGPPGTGKTLLARTIAKILGSSQVQLINGPEIISKYLGESERNLRGYFDVAQESYRKHGDSSELYVIIIDEIEAICKPRGKSDFSAAGVAYDSLVNQLLTLMDGLSEVSNTLVIGMTNRRELMDPALLRPGRFEVQIELHLPNEEGRLEIFEIHTRTMKRSGLLDSDISLPELAANTTGYSGAEIAGCVRAASSYALERQQSLDGLEGSLTVTAQDFRKAFNAISPANTNSESVISAQFLPPVFMSLGAHHERVITSLLDIARSLHHTPYSRLQSVLLYGPRGTGKTSLAAQVAVIGQFKIVKVITASSIVGLPDIQKVDFIKQAFTEAMKAESSIIVLDDLHRLLEYVPIGAQVSVSHSMMHVITTMLSTPPPAMSSILVIGTIVAENLSELIHGSSGLGLYNLFSWRYLVPPMELSAITEFLNFKQLLRADGSGRLTPPQQLRSIPVKQLIQALECACQETLFGQSPTNVDQRRFNDCVMKQEVAEAYSE